MPILAILTPISAMAQSLRSVDAVLQLVEPNTTLIFGEMHTLRETRSLLMEVLKKGFATQTINGFSTEYILAENEDAFQSYLRDPKAEPGTEAENRFLQTINDLKYVWTEDSQNIEFFRFLRMQKLKYGEQIKICGLDVLPSASKAQDSGIAEIEIRTQRFKGMPEKLLSKMVNAFGLSVKKMIEAENYNYDREPMMAVRAAECLAGKNRNLIHIGAFHAWSLDYNPGSNWMTTSQFLQLLMPASRILTVYHFRMPGQLKNPELNLKVMQKSFEHISPNNEEVFLETRSLPENVRKTMLMEDEGASIDLSKIWDYILMGPQGTHTTFWQ